MYYVLGIISTSLGHLNLSEFSGGRGRGRKARSNEQGGGKYLSIKIISQF
jgi:hypothetical protein